MLQVAAFRRSAARRSRKPAPSVVSPSRLSVNVIVFTERARRAAGVAVPTSARAGSFKGIVRLQPA